LYLNGHVHVLAHYTMDSQGTYITTGAGCMVRVPSTDNASSLPPLKWTPSSCTGHQTSHTCEIVFQQEIAGYTGHSFNADFSELTTNFYDYAGRVIHSTTTKKSDSL
jgi:hypothetical protein